MNEVTREVETTPIVEPATEAARVRSDGPPVTRRGFLQTAVVAASAAGLPAAVHGASSNAGEAASAASSNASSTASSSPSSAARDVTLIVNGQPVTLRIEPDVTLLDALRERMLLTGTKKGCDRGQCGACTVLVEGRRINACLALAVMHEGERITTVEGLAAGDRLSPLQAAFVQYDAFQCGFCTPGQLCSATAVVDELRDGRVSTATPDVRMPRVAVTDAELRERMSGNLCRCGAYPNILRAIRSVLPDAPSTT